ncbi:MAG TPA: biliverdin-producing heme oxygenase [Candidatus Angelobacter sp.]|nr:biliverdin-producing heme oxygenase [Candidatus Angelobacter sp.]
MPTDTVPVVDHPLGEDVLLRVKRATQEHHRRLESILPIARDAFSLGDYLFVLEKFLGIYRPLEARIMEISGMPESLQLDRRRKTALLEQDLSDLGVERQTFMALPHASVPALHAVPEALGAMYVLEGATLGGQYISRSAGRNLGLDREKGCRFFSSYGPEVGSMWRSFGQVVREQIGSTDAQTRFIAGAANTFSCFEQWMGRDSNG